MAWNWPASIICLRACRILSPNITARSVARYQYNRAVQAANGDKSQVDEAIFRYPGPPPRSKETALLMFADGVEARARAERPGSDEELRTLVRSVIESRQKDGQLDDAPLSQRDMAHIIKSFVSTLPRYIPSTPGVSQGTGSCLCPGGACATSTACRAGSAGAKEMIFIESETDQAFPADPLERAARAVLDLSEPAGGAT